MYFVLRKHLFDLKEMNFFIMALFTIYLSDIPYFDIDIFDKLCVVGDKKDCDIMRCIEMLEERIEMFLSYKIYPNGWLVEDEYFRSRQECLCNKYPLLLSSRKIPKELFFVFEHPNVFQS